MLTNPQREIILKHIFIRGLKSEIQRYVKYGNHDTFADVAKAAKSTELQICRDTIIAECMLKIKNHA